MSQKTSEKSDRAWASLFSKVLVNGKTPVGDGWLTAKELRARQGISDMKMRGAIRLMLADGRIEAFNGAERVGKITKRRIWYRIVDDKNKSKKI